MLVNVNGGDFHSTSLQTEPPLMKTTTIALNQPLLDNQHGSDE